MKRFFLALTISTVFALVFAIAAIGCEPTPEWVDPDTVKYDAALDFALGPQTTRVGPRANVCCLVTNGGVGHAMYLVGPTAGRTDQNGIPRAARGELHIATPWGVDYKLATGVPAFGYTFAPDGRSVLFVTPTNDGTYALQVAHVQTPQFLEPHPQVVIAGGLEDYRMDWQGFFTPSGRYFIVGARADGVENTSDLHLVDVGAARVTYILDKGAFSYLELVTLDDRMIFENSTASTVLGQPSVQGLYIMPLHAAGSEKVKPTLIDEHTAKAELTADSQTLLYTRANGDLMMWDLKDNYYVKLASNVVEFSTGPGRKGPFVWITNDMALHVAPKLRPEVVTTAPGAVDVFSPVVFSPDRQHLYFFKHVEVQDNYGDLYHLHIPPAGDGVPHLLAPRASTMDLYFADRRFIYLRRIDATGDAGELVTAELDGSDLKTMANGVATGAVQMAFPRPYMPPPPPQTGFYKVTQDLAEPVPPPVLANLVNAKRDPDTRLRIIDDSRPVLGELAYGPVLSAGEVTLDPSVKAGSFQFSGDGYVLVYIGDADYKSTVSNWIGKLKLFQTTVDQAPTVPMLDGVSEMGPVVNRSLFVTAPAAAEPGLYFVKF